MGIWDFTKKTFKTVTGIQAYEDRKKANATKEEAEEIIDEVTKMSDELKWQAKKKIESFGKYRCKSLQNTVGSFIHIIKYMEQRVKDKEYTIYSDIEISKEELSELESIEMNASTALKTAGVAGSVAGIALSGVPTAITTVVSTLATASTGTAISSLSGAAATNATLAWLGGGSLAAGGGGVAAGTAVLTGITYASAGIFALAGAGIIASSFYSKKYTEATKHLEEVKVWRSKVYAACEIMRGVMKRCDELAEVTKEIEKRTVIQLQALEPFAYDFDSSDDYQLQTFQTAAILVKSMSELAQTPLLSKDGGVSNESSVALTKAKTLINNQL